MNDPQIAAALRARSPGALAELFDAYGDRLFRYCWCLLRNREIAQIALRDTLVVAEAHIARLADPQSLGPWLYSLARAECRRRRAVRAAEADEPPARPSQRDADSRLMAWNAVMSLEADELEVLDLACRHDVDLGLVLSLTAEDAQALLDRARRSLERALGAEILISRASHACPDRAEVMSGWSGSVTPQVRERVLEHAARCPVCGPNLPRNVSAARVFAQLPAPALSPLARAEVLGFFDDDRLSAYREFAVSRASALAESGFPVSPESLAAARTQNAPRSGPRPRRRLPRAGALLAGAVAVASAAAIAAAFVLVGSHGQPAAVRETTPTAAAASPTGSGVQRRSGVGAAAAAPVGARRSRPRPSPPLANTAAGQVAAMITDATAPLPPSTAPAPQPGVPGPPASTGASSGPPGTPASPGTLDVSPGSVFLGTGSASRLSLTAVGGAVSWSASTSSARVALSGYQGTLQAGQSVTLMVTILRADDSAGSAVIVFETSSFSSSSSPLNVQVSWAPGPSPAKGPWHPSPAPSTPAPSPSASPSSSPSSSPSVSPSASSS